MAKRPLTDASLAKLSYEQAIEKIEDILESVETGDAGLEDALAHCEDGAKLVAHCRTILDRVETRVANLTSSKAGQLEVAGQAAEQLGQAEQTAAASVSTVGGVRVDEDGVIVDEDEDDIPI